jgi:quercetin dioxygenase-like cupin family protein
MMEVQDIRSPLIPDDAHVLTVLINHPPGAPGSPPHRLPGGPGFGYMIDGEKLFEIEGEAPRVLRAGEAFWGAGGDVIHYQDANNRTDIPCSFVLTLFRVPGRRCSNGLPKLSWSSERDCASTVDALEMRRCVQGPEPDTSMVLLNVVCCCDGRTDESPRA